MKDPAKVITNRDLSRISDPATPAPPAAATVPTTPPNSEKAAEPSTADKDKDKDRAKAASEPPKDQAYWSNRLKTLQTQLDRDETFSAALQSRVNALTTDFVNRDDPAQRAVIERDRQKAKAELDRLKEAIQNDKKAIADLGEEARRAGVPPGWLR